MIIVENSMRTTPTEVAKVKALFAATVAATRAESGCLGYTAAEDLLVPGLIHLTAHWADEAALAAHSMAPHTAEFVTAMREIEFGDIKVTRYDVAAETLLVGG